LPTNHGFDEFCGNLYHLNAEEEPENEDYPGDMAAADGRTLRERFGPRGLIHSWADGRIEDTGPRAAGGSRRWCAGPGGAHPAR
jgi:arylsulfatase